MTDCTRVCLAELPSSPASPCDWEVARSDGSWPTPSSPKGLYEAKPVAGPAYVWRISGGNDYHLIGDLQDEADALSRMTPNQKLVYLNRDYERTVPMQPSGSWGGTIDLRNSRQLMRADSRFLFYQATMQSRIYLSADYEIGSNIIQLPGETDLSGLSAGTPLKILSDIINPKNRNSGDASSQYRQSEWLVVQSVDNIAKTITFIQSPKYVYGMFAANNGIVPSLGTMITDYTGAQVSFDPNNRPIVESYTKNQRVWVTWFKNLLPIHIEGGIVEYEAEHDNSWTSNAIVLQGAYAPKISGTVMRKGYGSFITLAGTFRASVNNLDVSNLPSDTGYGVALAGSYAPLVEACRFQNVRHGVTTSSITAQLSSSLLVFIQGGLTQEALITRCFGSGNVCSFDCHMDARNVIYEDCVTAGDSSYGYSCRGEVTLRNCKADGSQRGIYSYTEYESGDGSPASAGRGSGPYIDGKTWAYSDTIIDGGYFRARSYGLNAGVAGNIDIRGKVDFIVDDYMIWRTVGTPVKIKAGSDVRLKTLGRTIYIGGENYKGLLNVDVASAQYGSNWSPYIRVEESARLEVDGSAAKNSVALGLFNGVTSACQLYIDGKLTASLSVDVDAALKGAGRIICGARSDFSYSGGAAIFTAPSPRMRITATADGRQIGGFAAKTIQDDAVLGISVIGLTTGIVRVVLSDTMSSTPLAAIFSFGAPSASSTEYATMLAGSSTLFEAVNNSDFTIPGADGKFAFSFKDSSIYINNRLGRVVDVAMSLDGV